MFAVPHRSARHTRHEKMTEAYFGRNDFFPFNSGELKRGKPAIFALMEKLWGPLP